MNKYQLKTNTIYCGDNLLMLKDIPDNSIDLIYIDPPFNSNRNYEVFWGDTKEKRAFEDRFGDADAYINYMRPRIMELYRVLKDTGSFYYHCDWHASHYVKVLLDQVFGFNYFLNEIIWHYQTGGASKRHYSRKHDTIFFYCKSNDYNFYPEEIKIPRTEEVLRRINSGVKGATRSETLDKLPDDVFEIQALNAMAKERMGYPTQKPLALLERIIKASSNKNDTVLDAFCGCGTTLVAAEKLGRKWIGIDISPTACRVMAQRLYDTFKLHEGKDFTVQDLRKSEQELRILPHFEFQNWACIALGGIPNKRKSGDFGIDGKLYPIDFERTKKKGMDLFGESDIYYPIQVKQVDKAGRPDIDSFQTAIRRDGRKKGYFIAFDFSSDAIKEIQRLDKEGQIEVIPITVRKLIEMELSN